MKALVRACAGRPVAVAMLLVSTLLAGGLAAARLPRGRLPEISVPRIVVEAAMPGLPASEVRSLLAVPLEDALASAKGLVRSSSISRDGRTVIVLDFKWGEDVSRASGRVREIIDAAYATLPEGAAKPSVLQYDPGVEPLIVATLKPRNGDLVSARRLAEYEARSRLGRVEGVGSVVVSGGCTREAAVAVDMRRAAARGLTVYDVATVIASECADAPAGSLREGTVELVAVTRGQASCADELADIVAPWPSGAFRISDLAAVSERNAPRKSVFVSGGEECVALELYRRPGADPVATARLAREALARLAVEFSREAEIETIRDSSLPVAASIRDLAIAGVFSAAIVALTLFVVLGDSRAGTLVASSLPVAAAAVFCVLHALGRSLNGMSLGGLGLAIGMVSDNAVVVLDALSSRFSSRNERPGVDETAEAVTTVLSGTFGSMITTAVVFIPVFFLPGAIGGLFGDLAISIIAANVAGWFVAVLALPAAYRATWSPRPSRRAVKLEPAYRRALALAFRRPVAVIVLAGLAALSGGFIVATRPVAFMPADAAETLIVSVLFPAGTDPDGMVDGARALSSALSSVPGVQEAYGGAGAENEDGGRRSDPAYTEEMLGIVCQLEPRADAGAAMKALLQAAATALPGLDATIRAPSDPAARMLGLDGGTVVAVRGNTIEEADARADQFEARLRREAGGAMTSMKRSPSGTKPRVLMSPRREAAATLGISAADAALVVRAATEGVKAARLDDGGRETDVMVFASGAGGADGAGSMVEAARVLVSAGDSAPVPASAVACFSRTDADAAVARLDRADVVYLEPESAPGSSRGLAAAVARTLATSPGAVRSDESAFRIYGGAMASTMVLVLVLLYLTLGAQFESFVLPVLIMATIPLSLAGVGPALLLTGTGLDSGSILGLVVLFGVVVNNAIFLYEASAARRTAGAGAEVSAYAGASDRVRPVLATSLTTIVALLPLCLSPAGAAQRSMSIAMLGGMLASTALTLFVAPVTFAAMNARERKRR